MSFDVKPHPVLVLDFGAQYAQLIARRIRECGYYSELVKPDISAAELAGRRPLALVLSGGPASVYAPGAPTADPEIFGLGIPVFGICYGFQLMAQALGGKVAATASREYGATPVHLLESGCASALESPLAEQPQKQTVWMSHGDAVVEPPPGFTTLAASAETPVAAFWNAARRQGGVQWHPEVTHTPHGLQTLKAFLSTLGTSPNWSTEKILEAQLDAVRQRVAASDLVLCGLSGGVDSAVAAALAHRVLGDRLHCVFVDHGLLREGERQQVEEEFSAATGIRTYTYDAASVFLEKLAGVTDPEQKRKIIGAEFIAAFQEAQQQSLKGHRARFLLQGTLYPDVVESGGTGASANIKSHHNVGGLPKNLGFELLEPLRDLFKDEVRQIGRLLGIPESIVARQPFPGPGLAVRVVGEVTRSRLETLRAADAIARQELEPFASEIWQCPVVLLADVRSVGVQGDSRTYGHPIVLRPVSSEDAMTADWSRLPYDVLARISSRITNEVPGINRVTLDITSKPPGTIEWE